MILRRWCAAIFAALFFMATPLVAFAQDVTLTSRDGAIEISGTLLTFDGEFYRVQTEFGALVLDGQGVLCTGTGCPKLEDYVAEIRFSGAPDLGEALLPALFEAYAARRALAVTRQIQSDDAFTLILRDEVADRDVARLSFSLSSTGAGFEDLLSDKADIVMAVREVRTDEAAAAAEKGLGDLNAPAQARILALDALVPVVARGNPVNVVDLTALANILAGDQASWEAQGAPILLHGRGAQAGLQQTIQDRILSPLDLQPAAATVKHASDADLVDAIARDPLAIGVTRYSETGNAVPIALAGSCGMQVRADRARLKSGDYPFTAPLFLYSSAQRQPLFYREFLTYLRSEPAQMVIRRAGFVDQRREEIALSEQGERLRNAIAIAGDQVPLTEIQRMLDALDGAARLTPTLRFRGGSTDLGPQSASNLTDLAQALESGVFDGRELLFVGFGDGEGDWKVNQRIAQDRAEAVLSAVKTRAFAADPAQTKLRAMGFGEALPMACDDTEWGRAVNRRVEVWLR